MKEYNIQLGLVFCISILAFGKFTYKQHSPQENLSFKTSWIHLYTVVKQIRTKEL